MRSVFNAASKPKIARPRNIRQGNASNFQLYTDFLFWVTNYFRSAFGLDSGQNGCDL